MSHGKNHDQLTANPFLRRIQYISKDEKTGRYRGGPTLYSSVFDTPEENVIVNKKGETAKIVITKDLNEVKRASKTMPGETEIRTFNLRAERKMKEYQLTVSEFIKDKDILGPEFSNLLSQFNIKGLKQFCEEKIDQKKDQKIKPR